MRPAHIRILLASLFFLTNVASAQEREDSGTATEAVTPAKSGDAIETRFNWQSATKQSFYFLTVQHSFRLTQAKTRRELGGPFFADWGRSVRGIQGWGDGDGIFTNYIAHPMQGGVAGYIQIHNDPRGRDLEISRSREYWHSRLRATGWAAIYSTNFELGVFSESSFGNVGKKKGTAGCVDLVMSPTGGMGMLVAEDWLDRYIVRKLEGRTASPAKRRFYRMLFNPQRGFANVLRGKVPWHRDTRSLYE